MPGRQEESKSTKKSQIALFVLLAYQRDIQLKLTFESRLKSEKINM